MKHYFSLFLLFLFLGCTTQSTEVKSISSEHFLGTPVQGLALLGPLEGKIVYLLSDEINLPNCWMDSVHWTGRELYYGVTGIDFSKLLSGVNYEYRENCDLPKTQVSEDFDIYKAKLINGSWIINVSRSKHKRKRCWNEFIRKHYGLRSISF